MRQPVASALALSGAVLLAGAASAQEMTGDPWSDMDYGPYKVHSYIVEPGNNANKGMAIRVDEGPGGVAKGTAFLLFDTDTLRWAAGWTGPGFIDWNSINYNGRHEIEPAITGDIVFTNPDAPGWSRAGDDFRDARIVGRGGRRFGPQNRAVARWLGHYLHGAQVVLHYRVGDTEVLELGGSEGGGLFSRTLSVGPRDTDLLVQVAHQKGGRAWTDGEAAGFRKPRSDAAARGEQSGPTVASLVGAPEGIRWIDGDGDDLRLQVQAGAESIRFKVVIGQRGRSNAGFLAKAAGVAPAADLEQLTRGGPAHWTETVQTESRVLGRRGGPFELEAITTPLDNPYRSWMRLGGFDFLDGGRRAVVATWMGDVWIVDGLGGEEIGSVTWKRFATGLYEPLGVNTRGGEIFVTSRDQITRLHDLNGDGEADRYEAFNHDAQASAHFHEFSVGLETDAEGNFYDAGSFEAIFRGAIELDLNDWYRFSVHGFRASVRPEHPGGEVVLDLQDLPSGDWVPGTFDGYMRAWRASTRASGGLRSSSIYLQPRKTQTPPSAPELEQRLGRTPAELPVLRQRRCASAGPTSPTLDRPRQARRAARRFAAPTAMCASTSPTSPPSRNVRLGGRPMNGFYAANLRGAPDPDGLRRRPSASSSASAPQLDPETAADPGNYSNLAVTFARPLRSDDYRLLSTGVVKTFSQLPAGRGRSLFVEIPDICRCSDLEMNLRTADGEQSCATPIHGDVSRRATPVRREPVALQLNTASDVHLPSARGTAP